MDVAALARLARLEVSDTNLTLKEIEGVRKAQRGVQREKFASERKVKAFFARFHARNSQFK